MKKGKHEKRSKAVSHTPTVVYGLGLLTNSLVADLTQGKYRFEDKHLKTFIL